MSTISMPSQMMPQTPDDESDVAARQKRKRLLTFIFNKVADSVGRAAVTNTIKIAAITAVAGIGASSFVTIGTAAAASAVGSALYVYAKETALEWRHAKREERAMTWWDASRSRKMKVALLTGAAGGAFGAWLAGTDAFKVGAEVVKEYGGKLLDFFVGSAHAATLPVGALAVAPAISVEHAAAALPSAEKFVNALGRLWGMAMKSHDAHGKFMATLLKADPNDMNSVSPQFLKDRAHEVLRLKDIPWQDRLNMAHELGEEAQKRGNHQAVQFLKDLAKLEHVKPQFDAAHIVHAAPVSAPVHVATEVIAPPASIEQIVPIDVSSLKVIPVQVADLPPLDIPAPITVAAPVTPAFSEAATCTLASPDDAGARGVACVVNKAVMAPGDYVGFVAAEDVTLKAVTPLVAGSTSLPTEAFLHERIVADGVSKVEALRGMAKALAATPMM